MARCAFGVCDGNPDEDFSEIITDHKPVRFTLVHLGYDVVGVPEFRPGNKNKNRPRKGVGKRTSRVKVTRKTKFFFFYEVRINLS